MKRKIVWITLIITWIVCWFYSLNIYGLDVCENSHKSGQLTYYEKEKYTFVDEEGKKYLLKMSDSIEHEDRMPVEKLLGEAVEVSLNLKAIKFSENEGAFNYERYLLTEGYNGYGEIEAIKKLDKLSKSETRVHQKLLKKRYLSHRTLLSLLQEKFGEDKGSTYYSMLSGDKSKMLEESLELYKSAGIMHLFAVSGLHFGLIFTLIYSILRKVLPFDKVAIILCCLLMYIYLWWIGFNYSAIRAFILIVIYYFSKFIHRPFDPICGLCMVHLLVLIVNPFAMLSVSYVMSMTAYIAITMIYPFVVIQLEKAKGTLFLQESEVDYIKSHKRVYRFSKKFLESLLLSIVVTICLNPVTTYYFQTTNEWSFIVNVFVVSLAGLLLPLLIFFTMLNFVPIVGKIINYLLVYMIKIIGGIIQGLVLFFTTIGLKTHGASKDNGLYMLYLIVLCLFVFQNVNIKKIVIYMKKSKVKSGVIMVLLMINTGLFIGVNPYFQDDMKITFLNVGHGDSALLSYSGYTVLFDCGDISFDIDSALYQLGIDEIDLLVVSHHHRDHYGNYKVLVENERVKEIIWPEDIVSNRRYLIDEQLSIDLYRNYSEVEVNDNCIISQVRYKNFDMLLTGDLSKAEDVRYIGSKRVNEILKIAHHGSEGSTSKTFLEHNPSTYGIISCSNKYHFPKDSLLNRLDESEIEAVITKYDGSITVSTNGENYWIQY